ncbi:MAG: RDD family protein [Lysobacterales bacterium]|nr:MAG: RDD family protein [Xanthomonadales bacterium]RPI61300.1 MAG: RDD family protein [Xanthomonadales bacterium]
MARDVLDTVVAAETPEGILLELRPAGLSARFYAFLLDWLIRLMIVYAAAIAAAFMGGFGTAFLLILYFLLEWFYPVAFELGRSGATPGKTVLGLKVVMDNGLPVTPAASFTRNLLRVADFLPFLFGAAIVSMLLRPDSKRLGDLAAATVVVHQPQRPPKLKLDDVVPVTPALPLAPSDQAAIVALAARAPTLTAERLDELAAIAAAVSGDAGQAGPRVTRRILGVAQWAMGKRA